MTETPMPRTEQAIFEAVLDLPVADRAAYLDKACAGDDALRERVRRLLDAADATGFLDAPTLDHGAITGGATDAGERPRDTIDRYRLLELIGEGGFGAVYMAEQREPVQRRVALKIIKLGMDTRQVIARFEAERQALAMMTHPNIARVLDAGATERGRPYFVMELVRGVPITKHCDDHRCTLEERLHLFIKVCNAVQHAHQKGVVHRDLKPGNILVTLHDGEPVPKVIDFGIAKATSGRLTDRTLFTEFRQFIGTPAYMSPEQAEMSGLDIDTRSDIYSLGVLLYELLVGAPPFEPERFRDKGYAELQRVIRDEQPPRPSTRFSTLGDARAGLAQFRDTEPDRVSRRLRGDLDWIVMKALEKQRTRRYDTAAALAEDVRRFLRNEPVAAGPPTARYRVAKFISRHRAPLAAGAAMLVLLVGALAGTSWGLLSAQRERDRAVAAEAEERAQRLALERQQQVTDELMTASTIWLQNAAEQMRRLVEEGVPPSFDEQNLPAGMFEEGPVAAETEAIGQMASVVGEVFQTVGRAFGEAHAARARAEGRLDALAGALDAWAEASVNDDLAAQVGAADRLIGTAAATLGENDPRAAELAAALAITLDNAPDAWRISHLQRAVDRLNTDSPVRAAAIDALESLRAPETTGGN
jgi:hypothetical protein